MHLLSAGLTLRFFKDIMAFVTSSRYFLRTGKLLYFGINTDGPSSELLISKNFDVSRERVALKLAVDSWPEE